MKRRFYVADIEVFDDVEWPWGNAITSYYEAAMFDKIFERYTKGNKLIGVYKCFMPIVDGNAAYGREIFIASFLDNGDRAAASTSLSALKSLLANCSLDDIINEVVVDLDQLIKESQKNKQI